MNPRKNIAFLLILCLSIFSSITVFAEGKVLNPSQAKGQQLQSDTSKSGIVTPFGIPIFDKVLYSVEDYSRVPICGVRMNNIKVIVKILNGHFFSDTSYNYVYLDQPNSMWTNNAYNCSIVQEDSRYGTNNTHFTQNIKVQGLGGSTSVQYSVTKSEAQTLMNTYGIELSVEGFGKVSSSDQLTSAYGSSSTKTVTVTANSGFSVWLNVVTDVNSPGTIDVNAY